MVELAAAAKFRPPAPPPGKIAPWADTLRTKSWGAFAGRGLPNRKVEDWRYSDLAQALNETPQPGKETGSPAFLPGAFVAVFTNGRFDTAASLLPEAGVSLISEALGQATSPLATKLGQIHPLADHSIFDLNSSSLDEGLILHIQKDTPLRVPLHLRFDWELGEENADTASHLRLLILVEAGAEATLLETHSGAPGFATMVTEIDIGLEGRLTHTRLETLGDAGRLAGLTLGRLGQDARYKGFYLSEGGHFSRHEAHFDLAGAGADVQLHGAALVTGTRHCDNTTVMTHSVPDTTSGQTFRCVLGGQARGVYQGRVTVCKDAQHTEARQMSRALLLSHKATIATKPELEIFADDVKCAHGATAGELDPKALFFLRARGIPEAEARAMLVEAFLGEALGTIEVAPLFALAEGLVAAWLQRHASEVSHVE